MNAPTSRARPQLRGREKVESQGSEPVAPWSLIVRQLAILIWGGIYVGKKSGPISMESANIAGSAYVPDANPGGGVETVRNFPFEKLMADGKNTLQGLVPLPPADGDVASWAVPAFG
ncbi:MAG: hypothetical protein R3F11_05115 [Verrucomicrobiales bacterium]